MTGLFSHAILLNYSNGVVIMDKFFSIQIDDAVIKRIGMLAKKLGTSKKAVLEKAIQHYADAFESEQGFDVLDLTLGCWQRDGRTENTVRHINGTMRKSRERYKP